MPVQKPYVGDIGTDIILDVGEDISAATVSIAVLKPGGVGDVWAGAAYAIGGLNQYIRYSTKAGDFNVPGIYRLQPIVSFTDESWSGRGNAVDIRVYDNYQ